MTVALFVVRCAADAAAAPALLNLRSVTPSGSARASASQRTPMRARRSALSCSLSSLCSCFAVVCAPGHDCSGSRSFAVESTKVPSLGDSISEGTIVKWEKVRRRDACSARHSGRRRRRMRTNRHSRWAALRVRSSASSLRVILCHTEYGTHTHTRTLQRTVGDELRLSGLWDRARSSSLADVVIAVSRDVCLFVWQTSATTLRPMV